MVASHSVLTKNASQNTMRQLLFVTSSSTSAIQCISSCLSVCDLECCIEFAAFAGQDKHGHAANTQGACSQIRCGESPRALGQKVPLGDQKTLTLEPSAKLWWSCGSGVWSFAAAKLCHERLQERQLNGAHSFHASLLQMLGKDQHRKPVLTFSVG